MTGQKRTVEGDIVFQLEVPARAREQKERKGVDRPCGDTSRIYHEDTHGAE